MKISFLPFIALAAVAIVPAAAQSQRQQQRVGSQRSTQRVQPRVQQQQQPVQRRQAMPQPVQRPQTAQRPQAQPPQQAQPWNLNLEATTGTAAQWNTTTIFQRRAGVVCLARTADQRLAAAFQWFPEDNLSAFDKIAVSFSTDDGATWTPPQRAVISGLPEAMTRQFDPTLLVLPDGRLRLYFTGNTGNAPVPPGTPPTPAPGTDISGIPAIYSAISSDGVHYTYEPGTRLAIDGSPVIDCAVAIYRGLVHMIAPRPGAPGGALHATSTDGLHFTRQPDIVAFSWQNWTGNLLASDDALTFYGTAAAGAPDGGSIWTSTTTDGTAWSTPVSIRLTGGDPAAVHLLNGGLLIVRTGTPQQAGQRPGAQQRPAIQGQGGPAMQRPLQQQGTRPGGAMQQRTGPRSGQQPQGPRRNR